MQVPPRDQQFWHDFAIDHIIPFGFRPIIIIDTNRTRPGMCGWELLHRWIVADTRLMCPTLRGTSLIPSLKIRKLHGGKREPRQCCAPLLNKFDSSFSLVGFISVSHAPRSLLEAWKGKQAKIRQCKQQIHGSSMIRGKARKSRSSRASGRTCNCRQITLSFLRTKRLYHLCRNSNFRPIEGELLSSRRAICNEHVKSPQRKHVPCYCRLSIPLAGQVAQPFGTVRLCLIMR